MTDITISAEVKADDVSLIATIANAIGPISTFHNRTRILRDMLNTVRAADDARIVELVADLQAANNRDSYRENLVVELKDERTKFRAESFRAIGRVYDSEKHSENCIFCEKYPVTGHAQQSPQCPLCSLEESHDYLRTDKTRLTAETVRLTDLLAVMAANNSADLTSRDAEIARLKEERDRWSFDLRAKLSTARDTSAKLEADLAAMTAERDALREAAASKGATNINAQEAIDELRKWQAQIIHGPTIFKDIADVISELCADLAAANEKADAMDKSVDSLAMRCFGIVVQDRIQVLGTIDNLVVRLRREVKEAEEKADTAEADAVDGHKNAERMLAERNSIQEENETLRASSAQMATDLAAVKENLESHQSAMRVDANRYADSLNTIRLENKADLAAAKERAERLAVEVNRVNECLTHLGGDYEDAEDAIERINRMSERAEKAEAERDDLRAKVDSIADLAADSVDLRVGETSIIKKLNEALTK